MGYIIEVDQERCKGCELCVAACPRRLIRLSARVNRLGYHPAEFEQLSELKAGCMGCALCGLVCPETAIAVYRARVGSGTMG